jgi:glutamate synthase domain-containing protein 3
MVGLEAVPAAEAGELRALVERHCELTGSQLATQLLSDWEATITRFVRVIPNDYRRVLEAQERMLATGLDAEAAEMAAFEQNARDLARAGGS